MSLILEHEIPPLHKDNSGTIRVGNSRVLLEMVIRAFQDGASPESIVHRYSTLSLSDVYSTIGYYLRHQNTVNTYLSQREQLAESVPINTFGIERRENFEGKSGFTRTIAASKNEYFRHSCRELS